MENKTIEIVNENYNKQKLDKIITEGGELVKYQGIQRTQERIDERKAKVIRQRLIAFAAAVTILGGIGIYTVDKNGVYHDLPDEGVPRTLSEYDDVEESATEDKANYAGFIDYVNEMKEEYGIIVPVTEEEYKNYLEQYVSNIRGSR